MAEKYTYRNLIVWQRAQEFAYSTTQIIERVLRSWSNAVLVRQIVSSATSIGANVVEGHGRYSFETIDAPSFPFSEADYLSIGDN